MSKPISIRAGSPRITRNMCAPSTPVEFCHSRRTVRMNRDPIGRHPSGRVKTFAGPGRTRREVVEARSGSARPETVAAALLPCPDGETGRSILGDFVVPWGPTGHGGPFMSTIGYVPFEEVTRSRKAQWLRHFLGVELCVVNVPPPWNSSPARPLPPIERLVQELRPLLALPAVILEGPGAFVWAALLRAEGFTGAVTVLPGVNPRGWRDVLATAVYRRYSDRRDRVFVGSRPSAAVFSALGLLSDVGEPYGVDDRLFRLRPEAGGVRSELGLPSGRMLLYAGQAQRDHDLPSVLQVGLKARLLFPDLCVVVASPGVDDQSVAALRKNLGDAAAVHFAVDPSPRQVADLYNVAEVALTASTTGLETFGRAPAE